MICQVSESGYIPEKAHDSDTGYDLRASEEVKIYPGGRALVKTGLRLQLPPGIDAQVRSRSGLALKHGLFVLNSPGTIDNKYTKEIGVILFNTDKRPFTVHPGDRVAQLVFSEVITTEDGRRPIFFEEGEIEDTERKDGFGHTGVGSFEHKEQLELDFSNIKDTIVFDED